MLLSYSAKAVEVNPSDVFSQVIQIHKELQIIKAHFAITIQLDHERIRKTQLMPRHAWQKAYEIMVKINILRRTNGMAILEPINIEPRLKLNPVLTYEMTQRILQELAIFKFRMGIKEQITPAVKYTNKKPMDVFNLLRAASEELDVINGQEFTPSYVFGEAMRIYEDIGLILRHLDITDRSEPPIKVIDATPAVAFNTALKLLEKITELEISMGFEGVDSSVFWRKNPNPGHVYELAEIIIAELQLIKASQGSRYVITPAAKYYTLKTPSDVNQVLGWSLTKISQISSLR